MNITGLESLVFGVDDMAACRQYLLDYGLDEVDYDPAVGGTWAALDGTNITARHSADPKLPPLPPELFAARPFVYDMMYGAAPTPFLRERGAQADIHRLRAALAG